MAPETSFNERHQPFVHPVLVTQATEDVLVPSFGRMAEYERTFRTMDQTDHHEMDCEMVTLTCNTNALLDALPF